MKAAKSVVEIWLWGGPSQLETFDPKPGASRDYNGGLKAIPTNVPGMEIHEWWPKLASCADLFSVIRSMTHGQFGHESATYLMQTGRLPGGGEVCPAIGAVVAQAKKAGYGGDLPPYVILTRAKGRFSEVGFMGAEAAPLVTGGQPNAARFAVDGIVAPEGVTDVIAKERFELLAQLDGWRPAGGANAEKAAAFDAAGDEARRISEGDAAKVFDLAQETDAVRGAYGRTEIGQSLLAARRLVEYGVPYITVNVPGWDSHKRHFETMKRRSNETDKAVAAFLKDLAGRKLLGSTVVWMSGEFGRTPKVGWESPWNGGRGHYPRCFSALVAGGGFKGGCVVGASDETASAPVARPVAPQDFLGSIYELCGVDPDGPMPNSKGKKSALLPPPSEAGRLHELYAEEG
ncbi:MAG: DUF1501 domain-containing protein [Kiritimatiellae bacterium]|nr:DUF1501 domain-containing protein [Kiritimatiellia bacterium]